MLRMWVWNVRGESGWGKNVLTRSTLIEKCWMLFFPWTYLCDSRMKANSHRQCHAILWQAFYPLRHSSFHFVTFAKSHFLNTKKKTHSKCGNNYNPFWLFLLKWYFSFICFSQNHMMLCTNENPTKCFRAINEMSKLRWYGGLQPLEKKNKIREKIQLRLPCIQKQLWQTMWWSG